VNVVKLLLPCVAGLLTTLCLTPLVRRQAHSFGLVAKPVADRWHMKATPMMGGVAVFGGFLVGCVVALWRLLAGGTSAELISNKGLFGIIIASTMMFVVGLIDDKFKLRPATKLIGQAFAAAIVVSAGVEYPITPWEVVNVLFTVFWLIGVTNALNLLDNMDGVAAGVAAIAAAFLGITFAMDGAPHLAAICFALTGGLLGFLPFNFRPASIFMGDSGSLFIGSLLAGLGAAYPSRASASIVSVLFVPALIVIIPILDTLLVSVARTLAGRPISVGGRDHTSHRLAAMGLTQAQVALLLYAFAALGGALAIVLRGTPPQLGLPIGALFLVGLFIGAAYLSKLHTYEKREQPLGAVTVVVANLLHKRRAFEVLMDLVLFAVSYQIAYLLRWDASVPAQQTLIFARSLALAVAAKSVAFGFLGVYRGDWRQLSMAAAQRLLAGSILGSLITCALLFVLYPAGGFSRSILCLDGMLVLLLTTGARAAFRSIDAIRQRPGQAVLIYGAGKGGEFAVREMLSNPALALRPIGFLDDDPRKHGRLVHGFPVVGGLEALNRIVQRRGVRTIVLGSRRIEPAALERLRVACDQLSLDLLQLSLEFQSVNYSLGRAVDESRTASLLH
jgi:UDP-GlcNAc:undecaprenyl-phosphate/decaprenyl-phosphate GlcNAc-1-phosphate transferase